MNDLHSPAAESIDAVDWLVSLRPEYADSDLARWPGLHDCEYIKAFAEMRREFPDRLVLATDYLFSLSCNIFLEQLTPISREDISSRVLNRRGSMQGGMPWTDEENPWPCETNEDGSLMYGWPLLQLNLDEVGRKIGRPLPKILYQVWGPYFHVVEIDLIEIESRLPLWDMPNIDENFSSLYLNGWRYETDVGKPNYGHVGNRIDLEETGAFLPASLSWCLGDGYTGKRGVWADIEQWIAAQGAYRPDLEGFLTHVLPNMPCEQEVRLSDLMWDVNEKWSRVHLDYRHLRSANDAEFVNRRGVFQGEPLMSMANWDYSNVALTGVRMLYEPVPTMTSDQTGLNFFCGMIYVTMTNPYGLFEVVASDEEVMIGYQSPQG